MRWYLVSILVTLFGALTVTTGISTRVGVVLVVLGLASGVVSFLLMFLRPFGK